MIYLPIVFKLQYYRLGITADNITKCRRVLKLKLNEINQHKIFSNLIRQKVLLFLNHK